MTLPAAAPLPQAARWQRSVIPFDQTLTAAARLRHPTVAWWWGGRSVGSTFGAWCYLCDQHVATWSRAWPVTVAATTAILGHRSAHQSGGFILPGTPAAGTFPAADAAPAGGSK